MKNLNWKEIWKEFNKLLSNAEEAYEFNQLATWSEQRILLYAVLNSKLPSKKKIDEKQKKRIERNFRRWYNTPFALPDFSRDWSGQKRAIQYFVERAMIKM